MRKSLPGHALLPSALLTVTGLERGDAGWTVIANGPDHAPCPRCRQVSTARHSCYVRTLMLVKYNPRNLSRIYLRDAHGAYWSIP